MFDDLLHRCWEEEYFLFNPHTGRTHLLNEFSWNILSACALRPCPESSLLALVIPDSEETEHSAAVGTLIGHLRQLEQLGMLVEVDDMPVGNLA